MMIQVSNGELLDKYTILEIKLGKATNPEAFENVSKEMQALLPAVTEVLEYARTIGSAAADLMIRLRRTNCILWDIEDNIRKCEAEGDFGQKFVELARSVYKFNDARADLKRQINVETTSALHEVKILPDY